MTCNLKDRYTLYKLDNVELGLFPKNRFPKYLLSYNCIKMDLDFYCEIDVVLR